MRRRALKIETVPWLKSVMFLAVQPDFKFAAKNVQKFFSFVRIRFAAASAGSDAEKMRLHGGLTPGQQFHAHAGCDLQYFPLGRPDQPRIFCRGFKERKDVRAVKARNAPEGGNGATHLATLEGAEEAD